MPPLRIKRGAGSTAPCSGPACSVEVRLLFLQHLRIDVDDQRREQDQAADQDLEEAVDLDVVETVVEDAEHEETNDRVADAPAPAEQARAADDHGGDRVEQEGVELVLL